MGASVKKTASERMRRVRQKHTAPELALRTILRRLGYHYRLHAADLPGTPDLVFRSARKAIFVHGCYWHRHEGCTLASMPKTNVEFWVEKFRKNVQRDAEKIARLEALGWRSLIVWQCELKQGEVVQVKLDHFLSDLRKSKSVTSRSLGKK